jgi:hypothetical protein
LATSLAVLNHPKVAAAVDEREERAREARRAAADDLHRRSVKFTQVMNDHATAPPEPRELGPLPLAPRAYAILSLVESYIRRGADGVELGAADVVRLFRRGPRDGWSLRNVWIALASLRNSGYLQRVKRTVPVEQTKLGKPYTSMTIAGRRELARRQGRRGRALPPRCLHSEAPDAYARSQVRNVWTLGTIARAAKLGVRRTCGQLRDQLALVANCTATVSASSSGGPKSDHGHAVRIVAEPVSLWITPSVSGSESIEASPSATERASPAAPPSPTSSASEATTPAATPEADEGSGSASPTGIVRAWISGLWRRFRRSDGPC